MSRRNVTPEQQEASKQRRAKIRELAKLISNMEEDRRKALAAQCLATTTEGHVLSFFNQCMIASQRDAVSMVGGFNQWRKIGRAVNKGESGIAIFAPMGAKKLDASAEPKSEDDAVSHFLIVYIFDISQTHQIDPDAPETDAPPMLPQPRAALPMPRAVAPDDYLEQAFEDKYAMED